MTGLEEAREGAVTLGRISADIHLAGRAASALPVERRIAALARSDLAPCLARMLDPGPGQEIIRIARIDVAIDLDLGELLSGQIGEAWAVGIAAAIRERMGQAGRSVVRFRDAAAYGVAYLLFRAGRGTMPAWAFEEFQALDHLAPRDAALEMIAAAPALLPALVLETGDGRAILQGLLSRAGASRLVERLAMTGAGPEAGDVTAIARLAWEEGRYTADVHLLACGILARVLQGSTGIGSRAVATRTATACLAAALVRMVDAHGHAVLDALDHPDPLAVDGAFLRLARATPGLPEAMLERGLALKVSGPGDPGLPRDLCAALLAVQAAGTMPDNERRGEPAAHSEPDPPKSGPEEGGVASKRQPSDGRGTILYSEFAGTALVLPLLRDLELWHALPPPAFRAVLTHLVEDEARLAAQADAALDAFSPPERAETPTTPAIPATAFDGLATALRDRLAGQAEPAAWAELVSARLAEQLPGLAGSSPGYMAAQFLTRPGRVRLDRDTVAVALDPLPLGIVLTMAGVTGDRGPLPWLGDRRLFITIEGA